MADCVSRAIPLAEAALYSINGKTEGDSQGIQFRIRALICLMGAAKGPMEKCLFNSNLSQL